MTPGPLELETLTDGGQRPEDVGIRIADWISQTQRTLDLALYSVHVPGPVGDRVMAAVRDASARGVVVRALLHRPDLQPSPLHATAMPRVRVDVLRRAGVHIELTEQRLDELDARRLRRRGERDRPARLAGDRRRLLGGLQ